MKVRAAACAAAWCAAAGTAHADQPLWELGLGAGALRLPHYRGSDQSHSWLLPVPYAVYRGRIFRADRNGARAVLFNDERIDIDVSVAASAPTRSSDNRARGGMQDLAPTLEFGPNLNLTLLRAADYKVDLRVPLRAVFTLQRDSRGLGLTSSPVLNLDLKLHGWKLGMQTGPLAATRRYNGYFYSVDALDANTARPAYRAPGGFAGWQATLAASRRFADIWVAGYVRADSVAGAAFEASPLVRQRSNVSFGVAASWIFKTSDERVADER